MGCDSWLNACLNFDGCGMFIADTVWIYQIRDPSAAGDIYRDDLVPWPSLLYIRTCRGFVEVLSERCFQDRAGIGLVCFRFPPY